MRALTRSAMTFFKVILSNCSRSPVSSKRDSKLEPMCLLMTRLPSGAAVQASNRTGVYAGSSSEIRAGGPLTSPRGKRVRGNRCGDGWSRLRRDPHSDVLGQRAQPITDRLGAGRASVKAALESERSLPPGIVPFLDHCQ